MAFATANVRNGVAGDLKILAGDWTGTAGDADGTMTIASARIYSAFFRAEDSTTPVDIIYVTNTSVATGTTTTLTIPNRETVVRGRFIIFYA